jgi:hypothetical protein
MKDARRWVCLDCGKNTFEGPEDYYFLRDRLWRKLVHREQRHRMICRICIQKRIGRPLVLEDFKTPTQDASDPEDRPMEEKDYGVYDSITPQMREIIDSALVAIVASRPRRVSAIVGHVYDEPPAGTPMVHDWFYIDRIAALLNDGRLVVVSEGNDLTSHVVRAASPARTKDS